MKIGSRIRLAAATMLFASNAALAATSPASPPGWVACDCFTLDYAMNYAVEYCAGVEGCVQWNTMSGPFPEYGLFCAQDGANFWLAAECVGWGWPDCGELINPGC